MARRCLCARLLAAVQEDPRLRTLPLAARMLFLLVAEAAMRGPVPGVLPFSGSARVSLLVSAPETDVQTHLQTLRAEGLLADAEGGGLAVPMLVEAAGRAEVARRNGAAGGRPRRGETREAARERRQSEMMLPIAGGAAAGVGQETQETQPGKPRKSATTTSNSSEVVSRYVSTFARDASANPDAYPHVALGAELVETIGLDGARGGFSFAPVLAWLNAGATPEVIRAAIARAVARPGFKAGAVFSLGYFNRAVEEERQRQAPPPARVRDTAEEEARMAALQRRIDAAVSCGALGAA